MLLTEYSEEVIKVINEYSKTACIISSSVTIDARTEKIGLAKAIVTFIDDSKLYITEYLDLRFKIDKLSYSFHYQDKFGKIIFRFDNAFHKPALDFRNHKHYKNKIIQSGIPEVKDILEEIFANYLK